LTSQNGWLKRLQCAAPQVVPDAHTPAANTPSQRLARKGWPQEQPFVGRKGELRQLEAAFEAVAGSGDGRLIMLVGEPGIGKTALCEQLSSFVSTCNGRILVGHCYPEGSAGVPYQPFVEAFESFARQHDVETLRQDLGSSANEVARLTPALRDLLQVGLAAPENPEDDRLRLLNGVLDSLRNMAASHPLLLVLEDLHDADGGTLDLLVHLARHVTGTPLLVVGTYRDVEVDRLHPLSSALAELHRVSQFERVHLGELSVDEVQRLLATSSHRATSSPLADLVYRRSGGNPLFVRELLRFLLSEHLLEERDGALRRVGDESLTGRMPEGLRDVVGKRLSRLSSTTNQVLRVASVIGREFQLEVLLRVHPRTEDELESALEEAVVAALVEERSVVGATVTYRFSHAFFQQTLSDEILAPRRIRLHQQIARALEELHARRLEEHAAELAEHYAFSSDTSDLTKAVSYGELAAARAIAVFAYGEAARQLERALAVQELLDADDHEKRCDLLLALGEALFPAGETERVITDVAPDALASADTVGDRNRALRACHLALECLWARGAASSAAQPEYLTWAERAASYADPNSIERSYAALALAHANITRARWYQAGVLGLEALTLARRHGDHEALFRSAGYLLQSGPPRRWAERVRLAEESVGWPRKGVSAQTLGRVLFLSGRVQFAQGQRERAEELWRQMDELAERTHAATVGLYVARRDATLAIVDGHLEDALGLVKQFIERAEMSGASVSGQQLGVQLLLAPALYLGHADAWLAAFDKYAGLVGLDFQAPLYIMLAPRAVCLVQVGRVDEARAVVGSALDQIEASGCENEPGIAALTHLLQAAVLLEDVGVAQALAARLACIAHLSIVDSEYTCVARHLGDAAVLVGDTVGARAYYAQALEAAGRIRFRPELALTHLRLAELLLEVGDSHAQSEALEHLDVAISELQDMHMQPGLERGLALREKLTPAAAQGPARQSASDTLTAREREIASLVADGLSNRDIAERLVISEGTVEVHVRHILGKLRFSSRAQVARWFVTQGDGSSEIEQSRISRSSHLP
jgi:DNA-binding CsgD family transcriptional regulator